MCESISSFCNTVGDYGKVACQKLGEWGTVAGKWLVDTGSKIATAVNEFVMTTVWPALQQFWAWLTSLCSSTSNLASKHPEEVGFAAAAGAGAGAGLMASIWACFGYGKSKK